VTADEDDERFFEDLMSDPSMHVEEERTRNGRILRGIAVVVIIGAIVATAVAFSAHTARPARSAAGTSTNWTGYVTTDAGGVIAASATWTVPSAGCMTDSQVGVWAGLGGASKAPAMDARTIEQVGTVVTCPHGHVQAVAFEEHFPQPAFAVPEITVTPGDRMIAAVFRDGSGVHTLLIDATTRAAWKDTVPSTGIRFTSGECIVEAAPPRAGEVVDHIAIAFSSCGVRFSGGPLINIGDITTQCAAVVARHVEANGRLTSLTCKGTFVVEVARNLPDTPLPPMLPAIPALGHAASS
jgi:hypothetical protein